MLRCCLAIFCWVPKLARSVRLRISRRLCGEKPRAYCGWNFCAEIIRGCDGSACNWKIVEGEEVRSRRDAGLRDCGVGATAGDAFRFAEFARCRCGWKRQRSA